jgi:hypothetical protein
MNGTDQCYPYADTAARIHLALRAGCVPVSDLRERFGQSKFDGGIKVLKAARLVEYIPRGIHAGAYRLTPAGKAACPSRRKVELEAPLPYATMVL